MKPVSIKTHGILDYAMVIMFAVAPTVIGLTGLAALLSYALAAVHFLMTLLTAFPKGLFKVIPITLHNWVERVVGVVLIAVAFIPAINASQNAQAFYITVGIIILVAERLTDYS